MPFFLLLLLLQELRLILGTGARIQPRAAKAPMRVWPRVKGPEPSLRLIYAAQLPENQLLGTILRISGRAEQFCRSADRAERGGGGRERHQG